MKGFRIVSGEKPTRAGPSSRAEAAGSSAAGNGPSGQNQGSAPRGVVTKWSASRSSLGVRVVACQRGAPVQTVRVAWCSGSTSASSAAKTGDGRRFLDVVIAIGEQEGVPTMTAGTLTSSTSEFAEVVTGRYKLCESRLERDGGTDGRCRSSEQSASPG